MLFATKSYKELANLLATLVGVIGLAFLVHLHIAHAAPTITANTTTANVTKADTQTSTAATTTAAVTEVLSSVNILVAAVPSNAESVTIGSCVVTFSAIGGSTADETNCNDNAATVDLDTGGGDVARSEANISTVIASLTNVIDPNHATLTIPTTGATSTTFRDAATTTSTANITVSDGTGGDIATSSAVAGVIGVIQVTTLTIGGTIELGDVLQAELPTVGDVNFVSTTTASTAAQIADGLLVAVLASAGYASQDFTAATSSNTIVFTGKATGTAFIVNGDTQNASSTAQVTVITPGSIEDNYEFTVTINSTEYSYTSVDALLKTVVEGIDSALSSASAVSCTEDDTAVTCTAATAGTPFTISVAVAIVNTGGGGGGSSSLSAKNNDDDDDTDDTTTDDTTDDTTTETETTTTSSDTSSGTSAATMETIRNIQSQIRDLLPLAQQLGVTVPQSMIDFANQSFAPQTTATLPTQDLTIGSNGADVTALQTILIGQAAGPAAAALQGVGATGYFGTMTEAALAEYQAANGISPAAGYYGPRTRAFMVAAGLGS